MPGLPRGMQSKIPRHSFRSSGRVIGIDSMILIYAEMVPATARPKCPDFADLRERSKLLFYRLAEDDTVVLPQLLFRNC